MVSGIDVVVGRLRARQGKIVQEILARVREVGPDSVGGRDAEYMAGLGAAVAAAVNYGLTAIEQAGEFCEPVPAAVVAQARRAACKGVSLETMLLRYTAGYTLLESFIVEELENSELVGRDGALLHVLRAHASVLERLTSAVAEEYRHELEHMTRSPERRQREWVRSLLTGEHPLQIGSALAPDALDPGLDYELVGYHLGVIARGAGAQQALRDLATRLDRRLLSIAYEEGTVWAWLGGRNSLEMSDLKRVVAGGGMGEVSLAVGEPARDLTGWRLTHQQAQAALVVALRRRRKLTCYGDVVLLATVLKDEALAKALTDIYLSPLEDHRGSGSVLRETLRAYIATEHNASSTAAKLNVARTTVVNRLRIIEERLGRTLHSCPAELQVALHLDELDTSITR